MIAGFFFSAQPAPQEAPRDSFATSDQRADYTPHRRPAGHRPARPTPDHTTAGSPKQGDTSEDRNEYPAIIAIIQRKNSPRDLKPVKPATAGDTANNPEAMIRRGNCQLFTNFYIIFCEFLCTYSHPTAPDPAQQDGQHGRGYTLKNKNR